MLKRMVIENYRSCLKTVVDLHPKLSVLIGPNGSGKTNILQAVMLLNKMAHERSYRVGRNEEITVTSRLRASFQLHRADVVINSLVSTSTTEANNDVLLGSRQKWRVKTHRGKTGKFELPLSLSSQVSREVLYFRYSLEHRRMIVKDYDPAFRNIVDQVSQFCSGITYYGASQFTNPGMCPTSFEIEREGKLSRLPRLLGHAKVLNSMYLASKRPTDRYAQFMEIVGPKGLRLIDGLEFKEVPTSSRDYSVRVGGGVQVRKRHKLLIIPQFKIGRQRLSPNQLSEGTFKTLALLFHVINDDSKALLIEEPEVCVHHGLLSSILELIKAYSMKKQMILSTHSDYVLDHVAPENVYLVRFERSAGTLVSHIPKMMTRAEYSALRDYLSREGNLGEYWREGGLGDRP